MSRNIAIGQYIRGNCVLIDRYIAKFIGELNRHGYATEYCCSGLPSDHPGERLIESSAYICFQPLNESRVNTLKTVMQGLGTFKHMKNNTRPCIYLGETGVVRRPVEAEVVARWARFSERIGIPGHWPDTEVVS